MFFFVLGGAILAVERMTQTGINSGLAFGGLGLAWVAFFEFNFAMILVSSLYLFLMGVAMTLVSLAGLPTSRADIERTERQEQSAQKLQNTA